MDSSKSWVTRALRNRYDEHACLLDQQPQIQHEVLDANQHEEAFLATLNTEQRAMYDQWQRRLTLATTLRQELFFFHGFIDGLHLLGFVFDKPVTKQEM